METAFISKILQKQDLDLNASYILIDGILKKIIELKTEKEFKLLYQKAVQQSIDADIEVPDKIPGQSRPRKVPARENVEPNSTTDVPIKTLEDYYRIKIYFKFLDSISEEIKKRFKGEGNGNTEKILKSLYSLIVPSNWKKCDDLETSNKATKESDEKIESKDMAKNNEGNKECEELISETMEEVYDLKFLCNFYGFENEEDKLLTELKVFHSSFSLPKQEKKSTLSLMLNCF